MKLQKILEKKKRALAEGNVDSLAAACKDLGDLFVQEGSFKRALKEYQDEVSAREALGDTMGLAVAKRMLGEVYLNFEDYAQALAYQKQHLELSKMENNKKEEQRAFATLGRIYFCMAAAIRSDNPVKYKETLIKAERSYQQSLKVCEMLKDIGTVELMDMKSRVLMNLGLVFEFQDDIPRAVEYLEKAAEIAKHQCLLDIQYRCYHSLGILFSKQKDSSRSLKFLGLAFDIAKRRPEKPEDTIEVLMSKAEVYFKLSDFQAAKDCLVKAWKAKTVYSEERETIERNLKIAIRLCETEKQILESDDSDHQSLMKLYEKMGDCCAHVKNFEKSIEYYQKMLEAAEAGGVCGKSLAPMYVSLATTYKDCEQYELAKTYFEKELELWEDNPKETCKTMLHIADVLEAQGTSYDEVRDKYRKCQSLAAQSGDWRLECEVLEAVLSLQKANGLSDLADETAKEIESLKESHDPDEIESDSEDGDEDSLDDINIDEYLLECDSEEEGPANSTQRPRRRPISKFTIRKNAKGETPLHEACIKGNISSVKRLLERGHPVNIRDNCGWMPLHEACNHDHKDVVELLLDKGASINDRGGTLCGGVTPLHDAAANGNLEIVELLLDRGAATAVFTDKGETPLDCLLDWYDRVEKPLDSPTEDFYRILEARLKKALEKGGHQTDSGRERQRKSDDAQSSSSRRRNRSDNAFHKSLRRTVAEDTYKRRRHSDSRSSSDESRESDGDGGIGDNSSDGESAARGLDDSAPLIDDPDDDELEVSQLRRSVPISFAARRNEVANVSLQATSKKSHQIDDATSAKNEYIRTMTSLRTKQPIDIHTGPAMSKRKETPALLEEDYVVDDWLIDDLGVNKPSKRRRIIEPSCSKQDTSSVLSFSVQKPRPRIQGVEQDSVESSRRSREDMNYATPEITVESIRDSEEEEETNREGIQHMETRREDVRRMETEYERYEISRTIKVRVQDKLLLVPVPTSLSEQQNIGWLAKAAAQRYYSIEGLCPTLCLLTRDGALLSDEDPVTLINSYDEVKASVTSWNLPPLNQRYIDACRSINAGIDSHVLSCMDSCQATQILHLAELSLLPSHLSPVFRAINRQDTLKELQLQGNVIGDDGLKDFAKCLLSLTSLSVLNLSCNNITSEGLNSLASALSSAESSYGVSQALMSLDVSYNPLGDDCIKPLSVIFEKLVYLKSLNLQSCDLTNAFFATSFDVDMLCLNNVEDFNISYNRLGNSVVCGFLSRLTPESVQSLNLAATCKACDRIASEVTLFFEHCRVENLTTLDLSSNELADADILELVKVLERAINLKLLRLANNPDISSMTLIRLLERDVCELDLSGCFNIEKHLKDFSLLAISDRKSKQKLEQLTISVDNGCHDSAATSWWQQKFQHKSLIRKGPSGFLCLSKVEG